MLLNDYTGNIDHCQSVIDRFFSILYNNKIGLKHMSERGWKGEQICEY